MTQSRRADELNTLFTYMSFLQTCQVVGKKLNAKYSQSFTAGRSWNVSFVGRLGKSRNIVAAVTTQL